MKMVTFEDSALLAMGRNMIALADQYPCESDGEYSMSETEAVERSISDPDQKAQWMLRVGLTQIVDLREKLGGIATVVISKEMFSEPITYRLSMLFHGSLGNFKEVPADVAQTIASAVLNNPKSVDNPSGFKYARHYTQLVETPA